MNTQISKYIFNFSLDMCAEDFYPQLHTVISARFVCDMLVILHVHAHAFLQEFNTSFNDYTQSSCSPFSGAKQHGRCCISFIFF